MQLTETGAQLLRRARPLVVTLQDDILTGLAPDERRHFLDLAARVAQAGNTLSRAPLITKDP